MLRNVLTMKLDPTWSPEEEYEFFKSKRNSTLYSFLQECSGLCLGLLGKMTEAYSNRSQK